MSEGREVSVKLPIGWEWTTVAVIGDVVTGTTPNKSEKDYYGESYPLFKPTDLNSGFYVRKANDGLSRKGVKRARLLPSKSVLVTCIGATIGKVGFTRVEGASNQQINAIIPRSNVFPEFIYFSTISPQFQKSILDNASATTLPILNKSKFEQLVLPLPPLAEQQRIVEEIEKQLTRLDVAVAALKRVQAQLKRYRASVLKAACEGKLIPTEAELAHAEGRDYESADQLLERILKERRAKWEANQLTKMRAAGKEPNNDKWKAKYQELVALEVGNLTELPEGWVWTNLRTLAEIKGGITKNQRRRVVNGRSVPYLRVANVQRGFLDLVEIKFIEASEDEIRELRLETGDILFNEGGDRDKLGRGWIWNNKLAECIHQNHVFRARLYLAELQPKYISWYGNTFGQNYFIEQGKQTTNLASINMSKLSSLPVPLPPIAEQRRIVAEVERRLSVIDEIESVVEANLKRAATLRQSILKRAFEGKLVPQDPNDEPASVLLERIRAERASRAAETKAAKPSRKKKSADARKS